MRESNTARWPGRGSMRSRRNVVTEIGHRRRIKRRQPNGVHTQTNQVIEAASNAFEIADAVAVAVLERARVDLVDDSGFPPEGLGHGDPFFLSSSGRPSMIN